VIALLIAVRWAHEASLMALFGSACLLALLAAKVPELALESTALTLGRRIAAVVALIAAPLWLVLLAAANGETARHMASATLAGQILLVRLPVLLALTAAVWTGRVRLGAWLSGAALLLIAVTSHTAGAGPPDLGLIGTASDGLHLLTGSYWIGGLCALAAMLAQRPAAPSLGLALAVFAEWGMIAVALLVMTGMINAAMVLLGSPGHDAIPYLTVLALKLVLVAAMIALALVNQFQLLPRLGQTGTVARLKRHAGWELGLGVLVVGLAMTLALLPPTVQ
jgi:copper resistance protein D